MLNEVLFIQASFEKASDLAFANRALADCGRECAERSGLNANYVKLAQYSSSQSAESDESFRGPELLGFDLEARLRDLS